MKNKNKTILYEIYLFRFKCYLFLISVDFQHRPKKIVLVNFLKLEYIFSKKIFTNKIFIAY